MRIGRRLLIVLLTGSSDLAAQFNSDAPAETLPTLPQSEEGPSLEEGFITPSGIMPAGFDGGAQQVNMTRSEETGDAVINGTGGVTAKTDLGDTIKSDRMTAELTGDSGSKVTFFDNVELRSDNGIEIFADKATVDESDESIVFSGNVSAYQGTALHRGESATYYYKSGKMKTNNLRTAFAPFMLESGKFQAVEGENGTYYKGTNAGVTTHDVAAPNYWMRAKEITVIPDDRVVFRNLKLYAGGVPVLWLPRLTQRFDTKIGLSYRPTPGIRSNWGPFLLNEFHTEFGGDVDPVTGSRKNPTHQLTWNADIYSRRGLGLGLEADSLAYKDNPNVGLASGYFIYDFDPSERRSGEPRSDFGRNQRYRYQIRKRAEANWLPGAEGHIDLNTTFLSDRFFLEDFIPRESTRDFQPDNTFSLNQSWNDSHLLTAWARFRLNKFYQSDTRLPEIAFDQVRRPIFGTPILHESKNSIGIYRERLADFVEDDLRDEFRDPTTSAQRRSTVEDLLADTGFARFHTYHELSLPLKLDSGLHIIPRVGVGHSSYRGIQGPLDSFDRNFFAASVDASLKFSKRYPDWISEKWGLEPSPPCFAALRNGHYAANRRLGPAAAPY